MAINATTYLVETKYLVDDKASRALGGIGKSADQASRSVGMLKQHFLGLAAAALGGGFLFGAKKAFVDFNNDMEQLRIRMAGLLSINIGGSLEHRLGTASKLVGELQQRAEKSTSTTKELAQFLGDTIMPLSKAGIEVRDLAKFTDLAVSAAKAFGDESIAAMDISQALGAQGIHQRDRFGLKLLGIAKMTNEEFNKLGSNKKLQVLFKALQHPAIGAMKGAQEHSFLGELSTLVDKIQLQLGKAGIPLFKAITAEIQGWNKWLSGNQVAIQNMVSALGSHLKAAFGFVKGVFTFIVNHKDTLLSIAKAFLVFKAVKFGTGLVTKGVQGVAGMIASATTAFGNAGNASATLATRMMGAAGIIGTAGAALAAGLQSVADWAMNNIDKGQARQAKFGGAAQDLAEMAAHMRAAPRGRGFGSQGFAVQDNKGLVIADRTLASARKSGLLGANNQINDAALRNTAWGKIGTSAAEMRASLEEALRLEQSGAIQAFKEIRSAGEQFRHDVDQAGRSILMALAGPGGEGFLGMMLGIPSTSDRSNAKDNITVNISKVEVPAKDPDRWIIDLGRFAAKQVRAPRQARAALRR